MSLIDLIELMVWLAGSTVIIYQHENKIYIWLLSLI